MSKDDHSNKGPSIVEKLGLVPKPNAPDANKEHLERAMNIGRRSLIGDFIHNAKKASPPEQFSKQTKSSTAEITEGGDKREITDEDIDNFFDFSKNPPANPVEELDFNSVPPAPPTSEEREVSGTISEAVIQAVEGDPQEYPSPDKIKSERSTLPPASMLHSEEPRRAILPGSPPETGFTVEPGPSASIESGSANTLSSDKPGPEFVEGIPTPTPAGVLRSGFGSRETLPEAVFGASNSTERNSVLMEAVHGVPRDAIEEGTSSMVSSDLREHSLVEPRVQNTLSKVPPRFHSTIEQAMEILKEGLGDYGPLVEKFIRERRWTREEEEALKGAYVKTADHLQRLFNKKYDQESETRIERWREFKGKLAPTEKLFASTIIGSSDSRSNHETNIFDAFAKGVIFFYLIKQRPGSFIEAIGHPEISKPYGRLGGAENAGIAAGLRAYPENIQSAFLFRCYEEAHILTIANELRDAVIEKPSRPLVGKFEDMVRKDVAEFETAVSQSGISPEKFFEMLNEGHTTESLRSSDELEQIFKTARNEGLIYNKTNDLFDALELINDYMWALRMNPVARDFFLKFYLANYPLGEQSGKFYKMFGMCLFNSVEEINKRPIAKMAFEKDRNATVRKCFEKRMDTLAFEERKTLIADEDTSGSPSDDETDFSGC